MKDVKTTLLVIGGGPGGYVAAIRAGQLGIATVLVEGEHLGGTCLNVGCIPSKALIHAASAFELARSFNGRSPLGVQVSSASIDLGQTQTWKSGITSKLSSGVGSLLKKAGVQVLRGWATVVDGKTVDVAGNEEPVRIRCDHLLLATGSVPVELPNLPFSGTVISSTEALALSSPPKHLVVVGAGYIGLELGTAYRKLGSTVSIVESSERILPAYDAELTKPVASSLKRLGIDLHLGCAAQGVADSGDGLRVKSNAGETFVLPADYVLVAAGRRPRTMGFNLESLGLDRSGHALKVNSQCRTSMHNVWAIGDVAGEPMLAHRAMAQGEMVAEIIAGHKRHFSPLAIPAVCFTDPEVVVVGLSPDEAASAGLATLVSHFPFSANGRAMSMNAQDGFVRVVARKDNHQILGFQAVGEGVSELSAAFCYAIEMGAVLEDIAGIIHAHPTLGEAVQESALRALGRALHV